MRTDILAGDVRERLAELADGSVRCCVTSPPYWGLRDYGVAGQLGLERTPQEYVAAMVAVFREVRRVLADDGTLWLNLGDSYSGGKGGNPDPGPSKQATNAGSQTIGTLYGKTGDTARQAAVTNVSRRLTTEAGFAPKQLIGIPWRVAFALQDDGWWLRSDIIWSKPNPMPESVSDRPTKSHEYLFLLTKAARYYYDAKAIAEPATCPDPRLVDGFVPKSVNGKHAPDDPQSAAVRKSDKQRGHSRRHAGFNDRWDAMERAEQCAGTRNARSVWNIATSPFHGAHFATFPTELPRRCILAGSAPGDTVLDPFCGAGTTGLVAHRLGRDFVGIELNPEYAEMARRRIVDDAPLLAGGDLAPPDGSTPSEEGTLSTGGEG